MPFVGNKKGSFVTTGGKQHPRNECPAYGTSCRKCGKANHWQSVCRSGKRKQLNQGTKSVFKKVIHAIEDRDDDDDDEILTISTIEVNAIEDTQHSIHDTRDEAFATLEITQPEKKRKINLQCKLDTGAQINVLPVRLLRIIAPEKFDDERNPKPEALEKNEAVLSAYGGSIIKQLGTINIPCKYKEKKINCIFFRHRYSRASYSRFKSVHGTETNLITLFTQNKSTRPGCSD